MTTEFQYDEAIKQMFGEPSTNGSEYDALIREMPDAGVEPESSLPFANPYSLKAIEADEAYERQRRQAENPYSLIRIEQDERRRSGAPPAADNGAYTKITDVGALLEDPAIKAYLAEGNPMRSGEARGMRDASIARWHDLSDAEQLEVLDGTRPLFDDPAERTIRLRQQLRAVMFTALKTAADDYGKATILGRKTGLPPTLVQRNFLEVDRYARLLGFDEIAGNYPALARALLDPNFARIAHDDTTALAGIVDAAKALAGGAAQATLGLAESTLRTPDALARGTGFIAGMVERTGLPAALNPARGLQDVFEFAARGELPTGTKVAQGASDAADAVGRAQTTLSNDTATFGETFGRLAQKGQAADAALAAALKGDTTALVQTLTDPEAWAGFIGQAAPSLYTSFKSGGSIPFIAYLEAMSSANDAAQFEQMTGQRISDADFTQASLQAGLINSVLERIGLDKVLGAPGGGLVSIIRATLAEGGTEALQQFNSNAAALAYNADAELTQGVLSSAMGGAGTGGVASSISSVATRGQQYAQERRQQAAQARRTADGVAAVAAAAQTSKLVARDPAALAQFINATTKNADVYVDADTLAQTLEGNPDAQTAINAMPTVAAQIDEALATGGTVRIPVAELAAHSPQLVEQLAPHLRATPDAMSVTEADSFMQSEAATISEQAQTVLEQEATDTGFVESAHRVESAILDQLTTANRFTADVNKTYATLARDFYVTQAARLGITPEDMHARYPLSIAAETILGGAYDQFAGRNTADAKAQRAIAKAERMLAAGKDPERVRLATGVFRGLDGQLRYEIADHRARMTDAFDALPESDVWGDDDVTARLGDVLVHPALFAAYPELAAVKVAKRGGWGAVASTQQGAYGATSNTIALSPNARDPLSTLLHEVQHVIQFREGFAVGGTGESAFDALPADRRQRLAQQVIAQAAEDLARREAELAELERAVELPEARTALAAGRRYVETRDRALLDDDGDPSGPDVQAAFRIALAAQEAFRLAAYGTREISELTPAQRAADSAVLTYSNVKEFRAHLRARAKAISAAQADIARLEAGDWYTTREALRKSGDLDRLYRALAGEIEARDVQARQRLTPPERAALPPYSSENFDPADIIVAFDSLTQGVAASEGGTVRRGAFNPSTNTIALLKNADLSTFVHELGHFQLEVLADIAARDDAPTDIAADAAALMRWFGVDSIGAWRAMTLEQKRVHHEKFARGFEAYLFEGRAPSAELQGVFARVRAWMIRVYKSLADLNIELTDEVRGVFDRLLATDSQIRELTVTRDLVPLFGEQDFPGDAAAWREYEAAARGAYTTAVDELSARSLRDMAYASRARLRALRDFQRDADMKREATQAEVAAEVATRPVYAAAEFIRRGTLPDAALNGLSQPQRRALTEAGLQSTKLDLAALKAMYGDAPAAPWRYLSTGPHGLAGTDGLHPDTAAELFGFDSGDALVRALLDAPPMAEVIEAETDRRVLERYGDLANPAEAAKAADEAVHNEVRQRFVATELKALQKATYSTHDMVKAVKAQAAAMLAQKKVRDIRPAMHTASESRAARAAERAVTKGDMSAAVAAKRQQLWHGVSAKAAMDAQREVERGVDYLRSVAGRNIDPEYREQIEAILERHDLRRSVTDKALRKRQSLLEFIEDQQAKGLEPVIAEHLVDEARRQHYRDLTVEEFRGLVDTVKNIEHLGKLKHKLLTAKDERDFAARVEEAATSIIAHATGEIPERLESNTAKARFQKSIASFFAMHRKLASLFRQMDGSRDTGALWDLFVRPMNAAGDAEAVGNEQATIALSKLFNPILKRGGLKTKRQVPGTAFSLSTEGRLMVALNAGNAQNYQRLVDGEKWTESDVQAILGTLDETEWNFVQGVWDFLETYRPPLAKLERDLNGFEPQWVEATPVKTPFGTYRGGYLPIKYDTDRSSRAEADEAAVDIRQAMRGAYGRATTRDGFTKKRAAEVKDRPIRKDFGVIFQHVAEVNHRLSWQRWLIDANRLLGAKPIDAAIRKHYGAEVLKAMKATVVDIARGHLGAQNQFERAVAHVRTGVTVAGLGWNLMTSALQPLGLTQSMVRIGPKWVARGLSDWLGTPAKMVATVEGIHAKSEFMRLRGKTMQREINEIRNRIESKTSAMQETYFYFIAKAQMVADVPTWLGQYHKAIEVGADEATAVAQADQAVIDAQGGGQLKDLAGIQRGGELMKLFTNFYSYFNTTFNLAAERTSATDFKSPAEVGRLMVDYLMLFTVPAALGYALRAALTGGGDDDDEGLVAALAKEQLSYLFGTMVGLREIGGLITTGGNYRGPAGLRFFVELGRLYQQGQQGEVDEALLRSLNATGGILLHYPAGQVTRTVEGFEALREGETKNPAALLFGAPR